MQINAGRWCPSRNGRRIFRVLPGIVFCSLLVVNPLWAREGGCSSGRQVLYGGVCHEPVGTGILEGSGLDLVVTNLGSEGRDGFSTSLGRVSGVRRLFSGIRLDQEGSTLRWMIQGIPEGGRADFKGTDEELHSFQMTHVGDSLEVWTEMPPLAFRSSLPVMQLSCFSDGAPVESARVPASRPFTVEQGHISISRVQIARIGERWFSMAMEFEDEAPVKIAGLAGDVLSSCKVVEMRALLPVPFLLTREHWAIASLEDGRSRDVRIRNLAVQVFEHAATGTDLSQLPRIFEEVIGPNQIKWSGPTLKFRIESNLRGGGSGAGKIGIVTRFEDWIPNREIPVTASFHGMEPFRLDAGEVFVGQGDWNTDGESDGVVIRRGARGAELIPSLSGSDRIRALFFRQGQLTAEADLSNGEAIPLSRVLRAWMAERELPVSILLSGFGVGLCLAEEYGGCSLAMFVEFSAVSSAGNLKQGHVVLLSEPGWVDPATFSLKEVRLLLISPEGSAGRSHLVFDRFLSFLGYVESP